MRKLDVKLKDLVGRSGVGAIVEIGRQSFVTADLAHWGDGKYQGEPIEHARMAQRLGVSRLLGAPRKGERGPALVRFPGWMFCERCGKLNKFGPGAYAHADPECQCGGLLIGIRWVAACAKGHLFDVPWDDWAHLNLLRRSLKDPSCRRRSGLRLKSHGGGSAGYRGVHVECRDCDAASSVEDVTGKESLRRIGIEHCPGTQPWYLPPRADACEANPEVMMRASSRLHFPRSVSMLEIPPEADRQPDLDIRQTLETRVSGVFWSIWVARRKKGEWIEELDALAADFGCTRADLEFLIDERIHGSGDRVAPTGDVAKAEDPTREQAALAEEWRALATPRSAQPDWSRFLTEHVPAADLGPDIAPLLDRVVLVHRMKEVRVNYGYRRISADPERSDLVPGTRLGSTGRVAIDWLPAHAVMGEGVFLNLHPSRIEAWLRDSPEIRKRLDLLDERRWPSYLAKGRDADTTSHPWFVVVHTFAHLLIREMAFAAGYSAASLRERIYVGPTPTGQPAAGILIYTAEGDSEGTLGGLVRLGEASRLSQIIRSLAARASWCGQDPVCRESTGQGMLALNLSACHGCVLVPETSCAHLNVLLDRNVLFSGLPSGGGLLDGVRTAS